MKDLFKSIQKAFIYLLLTQLITKILIQYKLYSEQTPIWNIIYFIGTLCLAYSLVIAITGRFIKVSVSVKNLDDEKSGVISK